MQIDTARRAAVVVLAAVLLTAAGQGAALAADPQWESAPQWSGSQLSDLRASDPQWESAPRAALHR